MHSMLNASSRLRIYVDRIKNVSAETINDVVIVIVISMYVAQNQFCVLTTSIIVAISLLRSYRNEPVYDPLSKKG